MGGGQPQPAGLGSSRGLVMFMEPRELRAGTRNPRQVLLITGTGIQAQRGLKIEGVHWFIGLDNLEVKSNFKSGLIQGLKYCHQDLVPVSLHFWLVLLGGRSSQPGSPPWWWSGSQRLSLLVVFHLSPVGKSERFCSQRSQQVSFSLLSSGVHPPTNLRGQGNAAHRSA